MTAAAKPLNEPLEIRLAEQDDIMGVYRLLEEFHASEWPTIPLDTEKVLTKIHVTLRDGGAIFVVEDAGQIVASTAVIEEEFWFSKQRHLVEQWFYVSPNYRRSRMAQKLVQELKDLADELKLTLFLTLTTSNKLAKKKSFFSRHFRDIGAAYIYEAE